MNSCTVIGQAGRKHGGAMKCENMKRFFISGCQRSGTTLMRLVLEAHPDVYCYDEQLGYQLLIEEARDGKSVDRIEGREKLLGFKIPRYAEQLLRREFDDVDYGKSPSFYYDEPVLFMVRDPLDTIASMITLKLPDGMAWIARYGKVILEHMMDDSVAASRFGKQYQGVVAQGEPEHLVGAMYWSIKNQGLLDLVEQGKPVFPIQYESFVSEPEPVLKEICQFLDVPWCRNLLYHDDHKHGELDEKGLAIGGTNPKRSIDSRSVGRHRWVLSPLQVSEVKEFSREMLKKLEGVVRR